VLNNGYPDFRTEIPITRGIGTVTDGNEMTIATEPEQDNVVVSTDDFNYNIKKVGDQEICILKNTIFQ